MISLKNIYESIERNNRIEWVLYYEDNNIFSGDTEQEDMSPERLKELLEEKLKEIIEREVIDEKKLGDYTLLLRLPKALLDGEKEKLDDLMSKRPLSIRIFDDFDLEDYLGIEFKKSDYNPKTLDLSIPFTVSLGKDLLEVIGAFGDAAQKKLSAKSAESLRQMLGGKSFMQASMDSMRLLQDVMAAEKGYQDQLTALAVDIVEKMFPVLEQAGIEIDAEIVNSPQEMKITKQRGEDKIDNKEEAEEALDAVSLKSDIDKRRIINSITQGAAIRGTKAYYMFDEAMDVIDSLGVKDKYEELVNNAYGIYDSDEAIAMMMAMLAQGGGSQGGESEVDWNEEDDTMTIKARALTFPILLQEIIKGLYEFVSLQGFTDMAQGKGAAVSKAADKVTAESEDIRYGKFIYDGLRDLVDDYADNPAAVREMFFAEVYKLDPSWFKIFIENVINDELTSDQKSWVESTIKDLENPDEETEEDGDQPVGVS